MRPTALTNLIIRRVGSGDVRITRRPDSRRTTHVVLGGFKPGRAYVVRLQPFRTWMVGGYGPGVQRRAR